MLKEYTTLVDERPVKAINKTLYYIGYQLINISRRMRTNEEVEWVIKVSHVLLHLPQLTISYCFSPNRVETCRKSRVMVPLFIIHILGNAIQTL